jgi:DNA polymerase (family 10)
MIRGDAGEEALYKGAAELVRSQAIEADTDLATLFANPPSGHDRDVLKRLRQLHDAGVWVFLESALADLPGDLRRLFDSGAASVEQLARLYQALGTTSAADLAAAVESHAIRDVADLGGALEAAVAAALPGLRGGVPRNPLGRATAIVEPVLAYLRSCPDVAWARPAGSLRRGEETVGDIEVVASAAKPAAALDGLSRLPGILRVLHRSARRAYLLFERTQIGVRLAEPARAGAVLLYLTGSSAHVRALRAYARERHWRLTADNLFAPDGSAHPTPTEEALYAALELPYIPAEIRYGDGEVDVARRGALPTLVSASDIRGDLHMHTTWSDGRDSIVAMVRSAVALGYEYIAITDHSERSASARNLSAIGVAQQAEEIARIRQEYPAITILHGCEVDIMPDGGLDFPDRVLSRFDIVLASLHDRAGHSPGELLNRYTAAMKHPLVTIITHPTNRLVPHRRGYDLDYDRLFEVAVETGTALEIDGAPGHLDMDGALARRAVAAGVTVTVDSDSHRAEMLEPQMTLGIITARRGWVEPRHVLNARPLAGLRAFIARKRGA